MQYLVCPHVALLSVGALLLCGSREGSAAVDGCNQTPCGHGGTCVSLEGAHAYECECTADYGGRHCEFLLKACGHPVDLADGSVTDGQLSASSALDKNDPQGGAGRLHGQVPWRPSADDNKPWIQVDLNVTSTVVGVVTEGIKQSGMSYYVTTFTVSSSLDGAKWTRYTDPSLYRDIHFSVDSVKPTTTRFESPITARYFRLHPTNSSVPGDIRLKMDLLTCKDDCSHLQAPCLHNGTCTNDQGVHDFTCTCQDGFYGDRCGQLDKYRTCAVPLGLETGAIADSQLSASSQRGGAVGPRAARLNSRKGGWRPDPTDLQPWLQVDLLRPKLVTGVMTQGRTGVWVETYRIGYSDVMDDNSFVMYKNTDGSDKVFEANLNDGDTMRNDVSPPIRTRYIRVLPHTWSPPGIKLRMELLTCDDSYCSTAVGVQSGAVADSQMTASSFKSGYQPWRARLNGTRAWQMDKEDNTQWLQIDLLRDMLVTGVQAQGLKGGRVESYRLMYSSDGRNFVTYQNSTGQDMIVDGNVDGDTVVTHKLQQPVVARYLRFNPQTWRARYPRLRVEVLGCNEIPVTPLSNETAAAPSAFPVTSITAPLTTASELQPNTTALTSSTAVPVPSSVVMVSTRRTTETIVLGSSTAHTEAPSTTAVPTPTWTPASATGEACNQPLGLVSGAIPDRQLVDSSAQPGYEAYEARINGSRSWHMYQLDTRQWIQVDLGQRKIVTGIQTQGKWGGHIKSYRLLFHQEDVKGKWVMYKKPGGGKVLEGNSDGNSIVQHDLNIPMVTRYVRVNPVSWPGKLPRLRMELLGCNIYPDCYHPLGMEDGGIVDSQLTASSQVPGYESFKARLNGPRAWQPQKADKNQWLQIDLQQSTVVTGLETQGLWGGHIKSYRLLYSDNSFQWTIYGDSSGAVFNANHEGDLVIRHTLATPIVTRYLRFNPQFWPGALPRLRLEVLGCTGGWKPTPLPLVTTESHVTTSQSATSTQTPMQTRVNPVAESSTTTPVQQITVPSPTVVAPSLTSTTAKTRRTTKSARILRSTTTPVRRNVTQSTRRDTNTSTTTPVRRSTTTTARISVNRTTYSPINVPSVTIPLMTPGKVHTTKQTVFTKQPVTTKATTRFTTPNNTTVQQLPVVTVPSHSTSRATVLLPTTARASLTESTTRQFLLSTSTTLRSPTLKVTTAEARSSTVLMVNSATKFVPAGKRTKAPFDKPVTKGTRPKGGVQVSTLVSFTTTPQNYMTGKTTTGQANNHGTTEVTFTERRTITGKSSNTTAKIRSSQQRDKQRRNALIMYITVGVIIGVAVIACIVSLAACSRKKRPKRTDRIMLMEELNLDRSPLQYTGEFIDASDNSTNETSAGFLDDTRGLLELHGGGLTYRT